MAAEGARAQMHRRPRLVVGLVAAAVATTAGTALGVASPFAASAAHSERPTSCELSGPSGPVSHVINLVFDNVHFSRDNPNVPSDLE
ncbi:MAG: hypothetical protein JOZ75_04465, partial [Candidatus Dormibacteraeota bacterium]|nr:hypothetical protein [Candidatus Dormibacteraeota bacterium]